MDQPLSEIITVDNETDLENPNPEVWQFVNEMRNYNLNQARRALEYIRKTDLPGYMTFVSGLRWSKT